MIPTSALVILIIVVIICSLTILVAIWHTISTRRKAPEAVEDNQIKENLPSTGNTTIPLLIVTAARTPTPEAESPPPLANEQVGSRLPHEAALSNNLVSRRDSTHEIIDMYSTKSIEPAQAPLRPTTFAEAESKWAYFGRHEDYQVV